MNCLKMDLRKDEFESVPCNVQFYYWRFGQGGGRASIIIALEETPEWGKLQQRYNNLPLEIGNLICSTEFKPALMCDLANDKPASTLHSPR
jgi:hypothetical protein